MGWFRFVAEPPATPKGVAKLPQVSKVGVHYNTKWARRPMAPRPWSH